MIYSKGQSIIDRYKVLKTYSGGMGIVYEAFDNVEQSKVAIKSIKPEFQNDQESFERFEKEALTWVNLDKHPNIVNAFYVREIDKMPHIFIEFVEPCGAIDEYDQSPDLRGYIKYHDMNMISCMKLGIQCCWGMEYVSNKLGIVHRDLKPENILIAKGPGRDIVAKITDFGLVRAINVKDITRYYNSPSMDEGTIACGTPPYMAPEQFEGLDSINVKADIYAFGCVLYELLTGRLPFYSNSFDGFRQMHQEEMPKQAILNNSEIPESLNSFLMKCLQKDPEHRYPDFGYAKEELQMVFYELTGRNYDYTPSMSAMKAWEHNNKGISLYNLNLPEKALPCFRKAVNVDPEYSDAHYNIGKLLMELERIEEAVVPINRAMQSDPENFRAHFLKGHYYHLKGNFRESEKYYKRSLKLNPQYSDSYNNLGIIYENLGEDKSACECWLKSIEYNPSFYLSYHNLARAYMRHGYENDAIEYAKAAVEIASDDPQVISNYAHILWNFNHTKEAYDVIELGLERFPDNDYLYYVYGLCLSKDNYVDDAIQAMEKAISINNRNGNYFNDLGSLYGESGNTDHAIHYLKESLKLMPDNYFAHFNMACVYGQHGNKSKACYHLRKANDICPNNEQILDAMRQMRC